MDVIPFDDRAASPIDETNEDIEESLVTLDYAEENNSRSEAESENEDEGEDAFEVKDESEAEDDEDEEEIEEDEEEEEESEEEDDSTDYSFDNHEARDAMQLMDTSNCKYTNARNPLWPRKLTFTDSVEGLAEHGPKDPVFMGNLATLNKLSPELKTMILIEAYLPGPRTIRVLYNSTDQVWTYRCSTPANQIPFVIHGLEGLLKPSATTYLKKAPNMGADAYPFFNPEIDTLLLEYLPCGTSPQDSNNYITAMKKGARKLIRHFKTPCSTPIRRLEVTWCMNENRLCQILNFFRPVGTLEKVTLTAHDHYSEAFEGRPNMSPYNCNRLYEDDPVAMMYMVKAGELKGSMVNVPGKGVQYCKYPFEVVLLDSSGYNMEEEVAERDL